MRGIMRWLPLFMAALGAVTASAAEAVDDSPVAGTAPAAAANAAVANAATDNAAFAPLVRELRSRVVTLKHPVDVYHWFSTELGKPGYWGGELRSDDPNGYAYVRRAARAYFESRVSKHEYTDFFGPGLYAALDPVQTRSYGGLGTFGFTWVLARIRLEAGFRYVDLSSGWKTSMLDPKIGASLRQAGCRIAPGDYVDVEKIFDPFSFGEDCARKIAAILRDDIALDGFAYPYNATRFTDCAERIDGEPASAFVVASTRLIGPEQVRIFTARTRDARDERLAIQSLAYLAPRPGATLWSRGPSQGPYPTAIASAKPPRDDADLYLWTDLEGESTLANIADWMHEHLHACSKGP